MLHYTTYEHTESTEWVIFIHGAGGSSSIWYRQLKSFKEQYNVLLIDLRGHGRSKFPSSFKDVKNYSFSFIAKDVIEVVDHLKIKSSHFVGISLGTIVIRQIAETRPDLVQSMILAGAILKLNIQSQVLMKLGYLLKGVLPYMVLYKLFAFVILPKRAHQPSRNLFVREARKLYRKEFLRWYKLTSEVNGRLRIFREKKINIPTLFIMGDEDHMFLPSIRSFVNLNKASFLEVVPNCGHVVNVQAPTEFNVLSLAFLNKNSSQNIA